ncbi:GNAT family N-acetyltransferase [Eudoraea sp.]|uniref:GNAT family N-acetyltransferase n=1 Tax=Eudoraea sp. TaxID=1979955 RepID=UPI003C728C4C
MSVSLLLENEESHRLLYRKVESSDFSSWLPFHEEPLSMQYFVGNIPNPKEACKAWFDKVFFRYEKDLGGHNALISKETGKLIGMCGLLIQTVDDKEELEIGYSILPEYWRNGYASEAAKQCRIYATKHQLSASLISIIHVDNIGSQKVAISNGMSLDKHTNYKGIPVQIYRRHIKNKPSI